MIGKVLAVTVPRGEITMPHKKRIHCYFQRVFKAALPEEELKARKGNENRREGKIKSEVYMKSSALHACITEGNGQGLRKPLLPGPLLRAALYHEQKQRGISSVFIQQSFLKLGVVVARQFL